MHYVHKKARCDLETATFRTKTIHFFQVYVKFADKIDLRGSRGPWSSILLFATGEAKNAKKKLKLKKQLAFLSHFCHW